MPAADTTLAPCPTEREQFEAAMVEAGYHRPARVQHHDSQFLYERDQDRFVGWQLARAHAPALVPLTDEQANAIALEEFERHCGRPHPWEGAQPWVLEAIKAAHGITGAPNGSPE